MINQSSDNVSVIDTGTNTVVATISVGNNPNGVAITPDGNFAYVTNQDINNVSKINIGTNTVVATVTVGNTPRGIAITQSPFEPTKNHATIAQENNISVANNTAIPLATNVVINGTDIIHSPGYTWPQSYLLCVLFCCRTQSDCSKFCHAIIFRRRRSGWLFISFCQWFEYRSTTDEYAGRYHKYWYYLIYTTTTKYLWRF
ncbi:hypothetical protein BK708_37650 [Bacillus thuringiensis serovar yunnanensis]|nr:hypothetical protein BK708_37650 [Bacillus thuringiensis serovar yunnanensis]